MAPATTSTALVEVGRGWAAWKRATCALSTRGVQLWLLDRESTIFVINGQDFLSTQAARDGPGPGGQLDDRELPGTFYGQLFFEDGIDWDFFSVFFPV